MHLQTDVLVIGGGCTGTGIARDLSLRGLNVILAEREDIAFGTSGRNHGLLHSGGRYAVKDKEAAAECIAENLTLRNIARHTIWDSGGLFVLLEGDDPDYANQLLSSCKEIGIKAEEIDGAEARALEPNLPKSLIRAVKVPDGMIDPFALCLSNAQDAQEHGATILIHHEIESFEQQSGVLTKAILRNRLSSNNDKVIVEPRMVINAAGCWSGQVAALAGIEVDLFLSKGSLLIASHRIVRRVINRCRKPGSGDILVPGGPVTVLGTTSVTVDDPSDISTSDDEIQLLRQEAHKLVPSLSNSRILRAFAGVRPLFQENTAGSDGRAVSRGHAVIDHKSRDGLTGLISIVGGKLTTYRKMAEDTVDLACKYLEVTKACQTANLPLPGSEQSDAHEKAKKKGQSHIPRRTLRMAEVRHGCRASNVLAEGSDGDEEKLGHMCICESVTEAEIRYSVNNLWAKTVDDLRRRTRVGCGPCQGTYCGPRVASIIAEELKSTAQEEDVLAQSFDHERRKGIAPSMENAQTIQVALTQAVRRSSGQVVKLSKGSSHES